MCEGTGEEATTIKVASSKAIRNVVKLKRQPTNKLSRIGNWKDAIAPLDSMYPFITESINLFLFRR